VIGLSAPLVTSVVFALSILTLWIGIWLGKRWASHWLGRLDAPAAGLLLVAVGLAELFV